MFSMTRDIFGQAMEAMRFNGRRTVITVIGMAWGIATVVLLLAFGSGFGRAIETIFAQWGTNMLGRGGARRGEGAVDPGGCGAHSANRAGDSAHLADHV
jgi:putative ABC transport system permease protein